jgi:hypothetical protein
MTFFFRTTRFDTASEFSEGAFRGEDAVRWLSGALSGWKAGVDAEDWGWAVSATRGEHAYLFGICDHDTDDVTEQGARWCLRIHNLRDRSVPGHKKLFRNIPPVADPGVVAEIESIPRQQSDFHDIQKDAQA